MFCRIAVRIVTLSDLRKGSRRGRGELEAKSVTCYVVPLQRQYRQNMTTPDDVSSGTLALLHMNGW
jgi:hypothetical protein